ncbi:MAG: hypothetical protein PHQ27_11005 [Victivallales bacterium]|nr:hypothetical protein [Victivallales bacterium]
MHKYLWLLLTGITLLSGCVSSDKFEPTESDKLTGKEMQIMIAYARSFLIGQNKTLKFTPEELQIIRDKEPRIRVFYDAYKSGSLSIGWEMPQKQASAIANGKFMTTRDWKVSVVRKSKVTYFHKKDRNQKLKKLSPQDFEELLND